jgi:hypothetical protein
MCKMKEPSNNGLKLSTLYKDQYLFTNYVTWASKFVVTLFFTPKILSSENRFFFIAL